MIIPPAQRLAQVEEYYFARKLAEIRRRTAAGENIINLGIGSPDLMPSEDTLKELISSALEPGHHGYQPYRGIPQLRTAFADWYMNTYGVTLDPEQEILPMIGSKEAIFHISMAFLNPGDRVLIPDPGYPTYTSVTHLAGGVPVYYPLTQANGWYPDFEALAATDLTGVKIMWVNYPHMPTGAPATYALFEQLIAFGRTHGILICHDNPYSLILNPEPMSILSVPGARDVALELNSLSKSHNMAGWRIGLAAGRADYLNEVLRVKSNMDSGMFLPMQQAAVKALANPGAWHQERNEEYRQRRLIVMEMMRSLGCAFDEKQTGMFLWGQIPSYADSGEAFSEELLNQIQVFITPGFIFGPAGQRYIRISLCASRKRLQEALGRILEYQLARA
ncbi:MAG: aminotransferase class I/II-fold pyridoxal phosphate-dependent enzyme [Bacteroidia bacterium]|nr:aminotransferase class I/II-fold pyridoxal phosphate-dependent enzyme [Bacteroidia bacterium]